MSPLKTSLITALVSAGLTAGCLYAMHQRNLAEAGALRRQNDRLRMQASERRHAMSSPPARPALPSSPVATGAAGKPPEAAVPAAVTEYVVPNYRNEGQTTARAALQTFAWACDRGDADVVAQLIHFDDAARAKATELLASMPPEARAQWRSVDEMAASLLTLSGMSRPFPSADVLDRVAIEEINENRARLRLAGTSRDRTEFQRTAEGWKYVITEAMVDAYVRQTQRVSVP